MPSGCYVHKPRSPEDEARRLAACARARRKPEYRAAQAVRTRENWKNPTVRANRERGLRKMTIWYKRLGLPNPRKGKTCTA